MRNDTTPSPLDGPGASAHFPDAAALRAAVMGSKVYDDTMRFDDTLQFVRDQLGYTFLH